MRSEGGDDSYQDNQEEMNMQPGSVGIVGKGNRGEHLALFFARNDFVVKIFDLDSSRHGEGFERQKTHLEIRNIKGDSFKKRIRSLPIHWVEKIEELKNSDLLIEAVWDDLAVKQDIIKKLARISGKQTPILSETFLYLPSELSADIEDNANFSVAYFGDVEYFVNIVEVVCHRYLLSTNLENIKRILKSAGFAPYTVQESPGHVFIRLGCMGILSLFKLYDRGILSYDNLGKYLFATKSALAAAVNMNLAVAIKNDLFGFVPLFKILNEKFGQRFYQPKFLSCELTRDNFEETVSTYSTTYSITPGREDRGTPFDHKKIASIYIIGNELIHNNVLHALLQKKIKLYIDYRNTGYFKQLQKYDSRLYSRLLKEAQVTGGENLPGIDLIMDFTLESLAEKIERLKNIQQRFGPKTPILLNTPIYKIEDIAQGCPYPSFVFGMYTQKNYLLNTEMVITPTMDKVVYLGLRDFIKDLTNNWIETRDSEVRPLFFMVLAKMLEAVRILEEGIADKAAIEALGTDRPVFKEMDLFGLDKIAFACAYLAPIFPGLFEIPGIINNMIEKNLLGYATGKGFYQYDP